MSQLLKRSDNIGLLAWRLVGDPQAEPPISPDITAAIPLYDELVEKGLHGMAMHVFSNRRFG